MIRDLFTKKRNISATKGGTDMFNTTNKSPDSSLSNGVTKLTT